MVSENIDSSRGHSRRNVICIFLPVIPLLVKIAKLRLGGASLAVVAFEYRARTRDDTTATWKTIKTPHVLSLSPSPSLLPRTGRAQ